MKKWLPWIIAAIALGLLGGGIWRGLRTQQERKEALALAEQAKAQAVYQLAVSDVVTISQQLLPLTLPISGTVQAVNTATIKARVAGELQQLSLREGDNVQAGQVIARVDGTESTARLAQARQQADAARAQRDIQQRQYDNNRALVDQGFISATALQASQSQLQSAQSNYQAALSAADVLKKTLNDTVLRSPIAGQVAKKWVSNGEKVGPDAPVLDVVDLRQLELIVQLSPADSLQVQVGQHAQMQVDGSLQTVQAQVARINPAANSASRSVTIYLRIKNGSADDSANNLLAASAQPLRSGLYLQGRLALGSVQALAIPLSAVRTDKPEPYVQLMMPQGDRYVVRHQTVSLGERILRDGVTWVVITQGLAAQQQVLSGQVGQLREGSLVGLATKAL
ncbi:MAG: efflux RND transporter periplasmic adaptor subunit [Comamonas sp.]